jgi:hypothetical protein
MAVDSSSFHPSRIGFGRWPVRPCRRADREVEVGRAHGDRLLDPAEHRAADHAGARAQPAQYHLVAAEAEHLLEVGLEVGGARHRRSAGRLPQNAVGDADLADVVQEAGHPQQRQTAVAPAELLADAGDQ